MLPPKMKPYLQPWVRAAKGSQVRDGQFATVFDNVDDTLTFAHFQTFDFEGMDTSYPKVLAPMVDYIFQRVRDVVHDPALLRVPKMLWADECWKFMTNGPARDRLIEAGKTWRTYNGGICLISQSAGDYGKTTDGQAADDYSVLAIVNEICPTKLLLSNPGADLAKYKELFKLNERETELFAGVIPKRQFFCKTPTRSHVLNVELDPTAYWTYTTSPEDKARRADMIAQHGIDEGIRVLAATAAE
jgi:type IV secretory pathway VirB4 component